MRGERSVPVIRPVSAAQRRAVQVEHVQVAVDVEIDRDVEPARERRHPRRAHDASVVESAGRVARIQPHPLEHRRHEDVPRRLQRVQEVRAAVGVEVADRGGGELLRAHEVDEAVSIEVGELDEEVRHLARVDQVGPRDRLSAETVRAVVLEERHDPIDERTSRDPPRMADQVDVAVAVPVTGREAVPVHRLVGGDELRRADRQRAAGVQDRREPEVARARQAGRDDEEVARAAADQVGDVRVRVDRAGRERDDRSRSSGPRPRSGRRGDPSRRTRRRRGRRRHRPRGRARRASPRACSTTEARTGRSRRP